MPPTRRKPVINVHCHLLNFDFVPDRTIKLLTGIPEDIAEEEWVSAVAGVVFALVPGKTYNRVCEYLTTFRSDIVTVARRYLQDMDRARIDTCAPLMMDLEQSVPRNGDDENVPYREQIDAVSLLVATYPWRVFPFVMFDPRRPDAADLCIDALTNKGFVGVKMYPALGYHPSPRAAWQRNVPGHVVDNLKKLYSHCADGRVPITAHASVGGAYSVGADDKETGVWPLTEVSNWLDPLREYRLKINFAHLGGNYLHEDGAKRLQSATWRREILNWIARSGTDPDFGSVYGDLSYHDMALCRDTAARYFGDLREVMENADTARGVLFGTDASMISHTWTEAEYARPFRDTKKLDDSAKELIFSDNPTRFLFGDGRIPESYVSFVRGSAGAGLPLPEWIETDGAGCRIVTSVP
jgi:predicted TIM-barrel fold metal-dependent hydrolase